MSRMIEQDKENIIHTYARFNAVLTHGQGALCYDENEKEYIDFTAGIGVNSLGFADKDWSEAVCRQICTLQHASNLYYTMPGTQLAKKLTSVTGYDKVCFANSGAEANEAAIKIVRKYSFDKYGPGRNVILTLVNSFHGRTVTTLSATGQDAFHNYFFPFTEGFRYVEANRADLLAQELDDSVCAVMYEHIQGEGGVLPLNLEFVQQMQALCREKDILLIADEVQTGVGRTGEFLSSRHYGAEPDITTLAKGLGGGLPIGAVLCNEKTSSVLGFGDHGTTYGGNPVACAGALVCVEKISQPEFLKEVREKADYIKSRLEAMQEIESITGLGLMIGIKLKTKAAKDVVASCLENGLMVLTAKEKIRFLPPLTISAEEMERGICIFKQVLEAE